MIGRFPRTRLVFSLTKSSWFHPRNSCRRYCAFSTVLSEEKIRSSGEQAASARAGLKIAIMRETYNVWERRVPLTPGQVRDLISESNGRLQFIVQPSSSRCFRDSEYIQVGATISEDLTPAEVILAVKRPKKTSDGYLIPNKIYMFFSHTIKGQHENMGLLRDCLERGIQLFDYERITKDNPKKPGSSERLVAFGRFAGIAGTLDSFHALGRKLLFSRNASTPFLSLPPAIMHDCLADAKKRVTRMGERIFYEGIYSSDHGTTEPVVFAVTGKGGRVHGGAIEILTMLPHEIIANLSDLPYLFQEQHGQQNKIYIAAVDIQDVFKHRSGNPQTDREDFKNNPTEYESVFAERIVPYSQVIINCAYWDERYPRLLTKEQMRKVREQGNERLELIADISCDVHGGIEFLERATSIENPILLYDPILEREVDSYNGNPICVLGVDILPSELPKESSAHFGTALAGVIKQLLDAKEQQGSFSNGIELSLLSSGVADSCITANGSLARGYEYLDTLMDRAAPEIPLAKETILISLKGHLFDSGLINQILDVIELYGCGVEFRECFFPPQSGSTAKSHVVLKIGSKDKKTLTIIEKKIASLVDVIEKADASFARIGGTVSTGSDDVGRAQVEDDKRVLLLGAGRVSRSFVEYLGRSNDSVITVVSDNAEEARKIASAAGSKGQHHCLNVVEEKARLSRLIKDAHLVVSLLPPPLHPMIASECIIQKSHLVTTSYESEEMRILDSRAKDAGIILLNEVGLDPGLDHAISCKAFNDIRDRGGKVTSYISVCGGLPAPDVAHKSPLKYKFSWSPRGVLRATQSDARYRRAGRTVEIEGCQLLQNATAFQEAFTDLNLEVLPNRDAFKYESIYGISDVSTLFRGTLRYQGFSELMLVFQKLGLLSSDNFVSRTWRELLDELRSRRGQSKTTSDFVLACSDGDHCLAERAVSALDFLELSGDKELPDCPTIIDAFCVALEQKLVYEKGERDIVVMHNTIEGLFQGGETERHQSSLLVYGNDSMSAMAKCVGYTAAASCRLILDNRLKGDTGLVLPTSPRIYLPLLSMLQQEGIVFKETITRASPNQAVSEKDYATFTDC